MFKKLLPLFYALGVSLLVIFTMINFYVFDGMELKMLDSRFYFRNSEEYEQSHSPQDIVIISVDSKSLDKIGKWPWRRLYYSRLIELLQQEKAKAIFFDFYLLQEDTNNPEDDAELLDMVQRAGNVYFDFYFYDKVGTSTQTQKRQEAESVIKKFGLPYENKDQVFRYYSDLAPPFPALARAIKGTGHANIEPDTYDNVLRTAPLFVYYEDQLYPTITLQMYLDLINKNLSDVRLDLGHRQGDNWIQVGEQKIPVDYKTRMLINLLGRQGTVLQLSYTDVLDKKVQFDWENKIVMVGVTVKGMMYEDIKTTALGQLPGIEYHATVLQNLLSGDFIKRSPQWLDFSIVFALCLIAALVLMFFSPLISGIITIVLILGYLILSLYVFDKYSLWIVVVAPIAGVFVTFTAATLHHFAREQRERQRIKNTFSRYLVPTLVEEILKHPEKLNLGGEKKVLTVLFSDIRDFTTLSESLPADVVVGQLNEYLDAMTDCVFEQEGMIDKYIGDAIMAIYGAPLPQEDSAERACRTAVKMLEVLKTLHQKWEKEGRPLLRIGVGINTGEMVVGNVGSQKIMNYTVVGDAVNLASRLEGANKQYGTTIIISEFTYEKVKANAEVKELGEVKVKGRTQPVKIYELLGWTKTSS